MKKKVNLSDLLTINQAADYVGVSTSTIRAWIRTGFLSYTKIGRVKFVSKNAVWSAKIAKKKRRSGQRWKEK